MMLAKLKRQLISRLPQAYEVVISVTGVTPKNRAQGPDMSHWKKFFDPSMAKERIDFAITKLTEWYLPGNCDPAIDVMWKGLKQVEMRGAFHYQRSGVSWLAQANHFLSVASNYDFHIYALDLETYNNILNDTFYADAYRILNRWREMAPTKKVMLYTNKEIYIYFYYAIKRLYGSPGLQVLDDTPIWYAQYWNEPSVDKDPSLPIQRITWDIWQLREDGNASDWGMGGAADVNVFNGTPEQMRAWLGLTTQPVPEPEPTPIPVPTPAEPVPEQGLWNAEVISTVRMHVRSYPVVIDGTKTGFYVNPGDKFEGSIWAGNAYLWMKLTSSTIPQLDGKWVAVRALDNSAKFIKLTKPVVVTPIPTPVSLYRVRNWGDPIMVKDAGLSVNIVGTTNFQAVGLYNKETGWGGVTNFIRIPHNEVLKLAAMQIEDEYEDKAPDWRAQKMNWLCKEKGTIYFHDVSGMGWDSNAEIRWGTIALGGNLVAVEGVEDMLISVRGDTQKRWRQMARLSGFRKTDWGKPLNELLALGLVHRCYCAYAGNKIGDTPKGIIYSPFFSLLDWDFAGNAQPKALYIPVSWLLPVSE